MNCFLCPDGSHSFRWIAQSCIVFCSHQPANHHRFWQLQRLFIHTLHHIDLCSSCQFNQLFLEAQAVPPALSSHLPHWFLGCHARGNKHQNKTPHHDNHPGIPWACRLYQGSIPCECLHYIHHRHLGKDPRAIINITEVLDTAGHYLQLRTPWIRCSIIFAVDNSWWICAAGCLLGELLVGLAGVEADVGLVFDGMISHRADSWYYYSDKKLGREKRIHKMRRFFTGMITH